MHPYSVLRKPVLSEKSLLLRDEQNKYLFEVERAATKLEVKKAIESLYEVKVLKIATHVDRGKFKRKGMRYAKLPNVKKAIITIAEGQKIPIFGDQ